jgi:hypothetical protein
MLQIRQGRKYALALLTNTLASLPSVPAMTEISFMTFTQGILEKTSFTLTN